MPNERQIEKLLRQAAEARRKEADRLELHPADRRALQAAVRERYATEQKPPSQRRGFWLMWPRVAWALAVACVLGLATLLIWNGDRDQLARSESPEFGADFIEEREATALGEMPPKPSETKSFGTEQTTEVAAADQTRTLAAPKPAAAPAPTEPPPARSRSVGGLAGAAPATPREDSSHPTLSSARDQLGLAKSSTPPARELKVATVGQDRNQGSQELVFVNNRQNFFRQDRSTPPAREAETVEVLNNFRVLPVAGEGLQIVDNDGSVYTGRLEVVTTQAEVPAGALSRSGTPATRTAQKASTDALASVQQYRFTVSGTNRSLQQKVVFTGALLQNSLAQQNAFQNNVSPVTNLLNAAELQETTVMGRAILGGQEVEVNATQIRP